MSADTRERPNDRLGRMRGDFRVWRGQRPFWAGLLTLLSGIPIMYVPYHNMTLGSLTIRMATTAGAGSLIIGVLLVVLGLTMWFQPQSRVFAGVAAILLVLVSLVVSNMGAFLVGFLPGLVGGALSCSWAPGAPVEGDRDEGRDRTGKAEDASPAGPGSTSSALEDDLSVFGKAPSRQTGADANHGNGRNRAG